MIDIICEFLGLSSVSPEVAFVFGVVFLLYLCSEFMSFIWAIYKAVFRHG